MARYETLFLAVPEFTQDEFNILESHINKTLQGVKGTLSSCDRWGKYRLAYPIRKNDYGIYGLIRFDIKGPDKKAALAALDTLFTIKYGDSIMRTMTVSLDPRRSLAYVRPESLEETPVRDVDVFLKENKMEGLRSRRHTVAQDLEEDEIEEVEELDDDTFSGDRSMTAATPPSEGN